LKVTLKDNTELYFLILNEKYDIICINPINDIEFSDCDDEINDIIYKTSAIRKWLNNDFIRLLPDNVLSCLSKMEVKSNEEILEDYVTIPSMSELGTSPKYRNAKDEGPAYELLNYNLLFRGYNVWTRSCNRECGHFVWYIDFNSLFDSTDPDDSCFLTPIIRLG
jgi:hypothetical protein